VNTETNTPAAPSAQGSGPGTGQGNGKRNRMLVFVSLAILVLAIGYGVYWQTVLRLRETTDDAYVNGNIVQITPQIAGTVVGINADDTQNVVVGQTLVRLDPADAKVALDESEANLALTVRSVRGLFATTAQLAAAQSIRQTDLDTAEKDLARRERLAGSGAISGEELQHARDAVSAAKSALLAAQQQSAANRARIDGTQIEDHPEVQAAASAVHSAYLNLARTRLPAPIGGFVAHRNVQLGQRVSPGSVLMSVVPLDQVWVDANFKELQIANIRMGQPATLIADLYGSSVKYHGTVIGFSAGTGASFALLPAQNATGNWIKVVQRLPVRILIDPKDLAAHPLQVGLSMRVAVSTVERNGARLPQAAANGPRYATSVFDDADRQAGARVEAIIAANLASPAHGRVVRRLTQVPTRPAT
jgi:membrane fusion protein (multidrug efflux system)